MGMTAMLPAQLGACLWPGAYSLPCRVQALKKHLGAHASPSPCGRHRQLVPRLRHAADLHGCHLHPALAHALPDLAASHLGGSRVAHLQSIEISILQLDL